MACRKVRLSEWAFDVLARIFSFLGGHSEKAPATLLSLCRHHFEGAVDLKKPHEPMRAFLPLSHCRQVFCHIEEK